MEARLAVAVLGAGRIGSMHAALLSGAVPGARLAGVADTADALAERCAAAHGVAAAPAGDLIADERVDAVAICTPTETHPALIEAAAAAGKAIFCEKPISLDLGEVDRALAAVARAGVPLMVGFNRRFDPAHRSVRDAVSAGELGEPSLARITSRDPAPPPLSYAAGSGGLFRDMTIHDFDMARYVVGSEVTEVYARGAVRLVPELVELGDVDTAVVTLVHANGCLTVIDNSRQATYGYDQRVEVLGPLGMAASENPLPHTGMRADASGLRHSVLSDFFIERYRHSYLAQWEAFVTALADTAVPPTTGADGRAALVLALAAQRSLEEHRPVAVAELDA